MPASCESTARLLQRSRVRGAASLVAAASTATTSAVSQRRRGQRAPPLARRRLLAVTDACAWTSECKETETLVHSECIDAPPSRRQLAARDDPGAGVGVRDISELRDELGEVFARECRSGEEEAYALELEAVVVGALARAFASWTLDTDAPLRSACSEGPADARLWLLELVVQPQAKSRQLAFEVLSQVAASAISLVLTVEAGSRRNMLPITVEKLEGELFATLLEMLTKAVVIAHSKAIVPGRQALASTHEAERDELGWVGAATECLLLFAQRTDSSDDLRRDRLRQVDHGVLHYLVQTVALSPPSASSVQERVVEMLIPCIYTPDARLESTSTSTRSLTLDGGFRLSTTAFDQYCSLELLLAMLYTTASKRVQELLFMVIFDLACEQLHRSRSRAAHACKDPGLLWLALLEQDFPSRWLRSPLSFSSPAIPQIAKSLATAYSSLFDKSTLAVLMQLQRLLHIDDYFNRSNELFNVIQADKNQENGSFADSAMKRIDELLASRISTEKFRGELWLTELLTFGILPSADGTGSHSTILKQTTGDTDQHSAIDQLEERGCIDENDSLRFSAQTKLWSLVAASASTNERRAFAQVLTLFMKRLARSKEATAVAVAELGICLDKIVTQKESDKEVIAAMLLLVLEICERTETTHGDRRRLAFDRLHFQPEDTVSSTSTAPTTNDQHDTVDSAASRILNGSASLDTDLLETFGPDFFLYAAALLAVHQPPTEHSCRGFCCGSSRSVPGDAGVCAALILFHLCEVSDEALARIGGFASTLILLRACETRVAVLTARFLRRHMKQSNPTKYFAFLQEMSDSCAERGDGSALNNAVLHAQAMLRSGICNEVEQNCV